MEIFVAYLIDTIDVIWSFLMKINKSMSFPINFFEFPSEDTRIDDMVWSTEVKAALGILIITS